MKNFATVHIPGLPQVAINDNALVIALNLTFTVVGAVSVLYIIIGAIRYAISNGNQADISQAKNTILFSVIGLVISISAFAIVQFVIRGIV